ncbi:hypothetical protein [Pantoea sp. B65]|uniref:hypothetical protein n=1 Tax=Pantoea sp. B65 TaxID=2813359 RepID=UPI0039B4F4E0
MVTANPAGFVTCCLLSLLLLAGCTLTEHPTAAGEPLVGCADISPASVGSITAERHYEYMVSCIKNQQFSQASSHYAIAGVQTWHDYLTSPGSVSKERHQAELRKQLARLSDKEKRHFWDELNIVLRDEKRLAGLCAMITLPESNKRAKMLWDEAKNGYLHCENQRVF